MPYVQRLRYPLSLILIFSFFPALIVAGVSFMFLSVHQASFITTTTGQLVLTLIAWLAAALIVFLTTGLRITLLSANA